MLINRQIKLPSDQNFFLFGPRGTGKSTLLQQIFPQETTLWIDLLDPIKEEYYTRSPADLAAQVIALNPNITHIVIDEIQKIPKLLDVVHSLIEKTNKKFILTGSSARKLKLGGANLLAGRAFVYNLFPLSFIELGDKFDLQQVLSWGMLPRLLTLPSETEKQRFLMAYTQTYLKEEIWAEQFIRKLDPFRYFLEVAAQCNGKIININNIAKDVGVDDKTIKSYFSILEDTLLGFFLEPFHTSFRKRLSEKPKFYFFDTGVTRSLSRLLTVPLNASTSMYGDVFEHFIILECIKLANYYYPEYRFSYCRTKDDVEIDLIVERPGMPLLCIEIKSAKNVDENSLKNFMKMTKELGNGEAICLSNDPQAKRYDHVTVLPWNEGIKRFFMID